LLIEKNKAQLRISKVINEKIINFNFLNVKKINILYGEFHIF